MSGGVYENMEHPIRKKTELLNIINHYTRFQFKIHDMDDYPTYKALMNMIDAFYESDNKLQLKDDITKLFNLDYPN